MQSTVLDQPRLRTGQIWPAVATVAAIVVGIGIRWLRLSRQSLWFDEGYTAWVASLPVRQIIRVIRVDTAPPLYYLLIHGWTQLFGRSEFALRSLSAVFSTAALLGFYPLAVRVLKDRWAVALAMALFAVSTMPVSFAHDARFYTMILFLAEMDLLLVLMILDRPAIWKYLLLIVSWTASLYTNNMMSVFLAGLAMTWLIFPGVKSLKGRLLEIALVSTVVGLLFLPWLSTMLAQSRAIQGHFWVSSPDRWMLMHTLDLLAGGDDDGGPRRPQAITVVYLLLLLPILVMSISSRRTAPRGIALAVFCLMPIGLIFIQSRIRQPVFLERAFIPSCIVFPLLIALPLAVFPRGAGRERLVFRGIAAMCLIWLGVELVSVRHGYLPQHGENWRAIFAYVGPQKPGDHRLVIFLANESELLYDYYMRQSSYSSDPGLTGVPAGFFDPPIPHTLSRMAHDSDLDGLKARLARGNFDEVVLVASHLPWADPGNRVRLYLAKQFDLQHQQMLELVWVYRYIRRPEPA